MTPYEENELRIKNELSVLEENSADFCFEEKASVFFSGDNCYTIVWSTSHNGCGWVEYDFEGKHYKVTDNYSGTMNTMSRVHSVRVPCRHLDGNNYTYFSRYVGVKLDYDAIQADKEIASEPVYFKGFNGGDTLYALVLSDIHGDNEKAKQAVKHFDKTPDVVFFNGDISSNIVYMSEFTGTVLKFAYEFTKGAIPIAYNRGNHETRGEYAEVMPSVFKTKTGGLFFTMKYGPLWALVLDTGEDKEDSHEEYSNLVDFTSFMKEESEWISSLDKNNDETVKYRICFAHQPRINDRYGNNWVDDISRLGCSAVICGHTHTFEIDPPEASSLPFRMLIEGGKNEKDGFTATFLTFKDGNRMEILAYDNLGNKLADTEMIF